MATERGWRSQQRTGTSSTTPNTPNRFPGHQFAEDTDGVDAASVEDESPHQMPKIPGSVMTAGVVATATLSGLAVGYWLGGWRASRRRSSFSLSGADLSDFARLAPEAAHLLKNPVVRAYIAKLVMRQLRKYLDS
jgi:hypothetical protein